MVRTQTSIITVCFYRTAEGKTGTSHRKSGLLSHFHVCRDYRQKSHGWFTWPRTSLAILPILFIFLQQPSGKKNSCPVLNSMACSACIISRILNLMNGWRWVVISRPGCFNTGKMAPELLNKRLNCSQSNSEGCKEEDTCCPCQE
jgi:hypothetical protein